MEDIMMKSTGCSREKYWSEKTCEEKTETLLAELIKTQRILAEICWCVSELLKHSHADGEIVRRIENYNEETSGIHVRVYERK